MPHVQAGDPLSIKARDFERMLGLIQDPNEMRVATPPDGSLPALVVRAINDTGVDLPKHASAPFTSSTTLATAQPLSDTAPNDKMPVFSLRPASEFDEDRPSICVTMKPIPAGRTGPVCIAGGCWARMAPTSAFAYSYLNTPAATLATGTHAYKLRPITEGPADIVHRADYDLAFVRLGNERRATRAARYVMDSPSPISPTFSVLTGGFPFVTIPLAATHNVNSCWQAGTLANSIRPVRDGLYLATMSIGLKNSGRLAPLQGAFASNVVGPAAAIWAWDTLNAFSIYDGYNPVVSLNAAGIIESTTSESWLLQVIDLVSASAGWQVMAAEVSLWRIR